MRQNAIQLEDVGVIVFDFDGVLTDNFVHVDQNGSESVRCSRADGLAFDVLRKLGKKSVILSTEANPVVAARARKLKVPVMQGISSKPEALVELTKELGVNLSQVLYVGNDLNDVIAMGMCGYSACPADSHEKIKTIATITLSARGGEGVARALIEDVFNVDIVKTLYS